MRKFFGTWYFVLVAVSEKIRTADPTPPTGELSLRCLDRGVDLWMRCWTRPGMDVRGVLRTWFWDRVLCRSIYRMIMIYIMIRGSVVWTGVNYSCWPDKNWSDKGLGVRTRWRPWILTGLSDGWSAWFAFLLQGIIYIQYSTRPSGVVMHVFRTLK